MRIYEVFYSDMQANAKFKTLQPESAENFVTKYSKLPKVEYMRLVLETCVHNFRSDILYSLAKMSKEAGDEALVSMYNGCIMLNPVLDSDTWSNISYSYNYFKQSDNRVRELEPPIDIPTMFEDDMIPDDVVPSTSTRERKKKLSSIPYAKFANLENHLTSKIVGQPQAIKQVVAALKRSQVNLNDPNRPLAVLLFAGPSGVGKTFIAKELQKYLFTGDIVRVDCGEFQLKHENQKLIGCFPAGAKVQTDKGVVPIEEVNIRSLVLTHEGDFKKVVCKHVGRSKVDLIKLTTAGTSNEITCTLNHEIYAIKGDDHDVKNAKFYHAGQIEVGDMLIKPVVTPKRNTFKGFSFHRVLDISTVPYDGRVYDLTVEKRSTYTVSGFVVHNSPPGFIGHDEGGQLTKEMGKNPQTVLLLDEVEKAHPDFWNTFLTAFDEGYMTDSKGNKVSFKDAIIIMTSNLGNDKISAASFGKKTGFTANLENGYNSKVNPKRDMVERETEEAIHKHFKPEFVNRIDDIVIFNHLEIDDYYQIAELEFQFLSEKLSKQSFMLEWDYKAVELLIELSSKSVEGARGMAKMRRVMLEDKLADELMNHKHKKGTIFTVLTTDEDDFQIVWSK